MTEDNYAKAMHEVFNEQTAVYSDLETTGLDPYRGDKIIGVCLTNRRMVMEEGNRGYYFPFRHVSENLPIEKLSPIIGELEQVKQIGFNYKFDQQFFWQEGMSEKLPHGHRDVMLDHHLLNENSRTFGLKALAVQYVDPKAADAEKEMQSFLEANLLTGKGDMYRLPASKIARYGVDDVVYTCHLDEKQWPWIEKEGLEEVAHGVSDYSMTIAGMERRGIKVDVDNIRPEIKNSQRELLGIYQEIQEMAGRKINLDSPQQVNRWLGVKSSNAKALARMRQTKQIKLIQRYRGLAKGISSYYVKIRDGVDEEGTLRCDMRLHGTISGRLSVQRPPLQSLPTDTSLYRVKKLLVARPGYVLLQADYSQAEVKIACHYGRETAMADIIRSGANMHDVVSKDLGIPRDAAKRLNFSVIYGIGARTLALNLDISEAEAHRYLSRYHSRYPGFRRIYNEAEQFARSNGYIDLFTGRRRHFNAGYSSPEHKASSNLIQGTVAEITREAQTRLDVELTPFDVHQILQVHDSCIMEVPIEKVEKIIPMVVEIMEEHNRWMLPMTVDIGYGANMEEAK